MESAQTCYSYNLGSVPEIKQELVGKMPVSSPKVEKKSKVNNKERRRNNELNKAFDRLQQLIPFISSHQEQKLSKIKTLRLANYYIRFLRMVLASGDDVGWDQSPLSDFFLGGKHRADNLTLDDFASVVATEIQTKNSYKNRADELVTTQSVLTTSTSTASSPGQFAVSLPPLSMPYESAANTGGFGTWMPPLSTPMVMPPPPPIARPFLQPYSYTDGSISRLSTRYPLYVPTSMDSSQPLGTSSAYPSEFHTPLRQSSTRPQHLTTTDDRYPHHPDFDFGTHNNGRF